MLRMDNYSIREPANPRLEARFNEDRFNAQKAIGKQALCAYDEGAKAAHQAVFDSEVVVIMGNEEESSSASTELQNILRPKAAEYCGKCAVYDVCKSGALQQVNFRFGVFGGLTPSQRISIAKEENIPQLKIPVFKVHRSQDKTSAA